MNKAKVLEFFDGAAITEDIHVVGAGAIGSHVLEQLARIGCERIHIWDFDVVSEHNITNQMFIDSDVGLPKVEAVYNMMVAINPDLKGRIVLHNEALKEPYLLNGYIFMCVDNIDVRKAIVTANQYNMNAKVIFDFRMRLTDAQHYAANLRSSDDVKRLLSTMNFTQEESKAATPVSACGVELSVVYNVKTIVSFGICNFTNYVQTKELKKVILVNMAMFSVDAF